MSYARFVKNPSAPEPTLPAHLATKNYVDLRGLGGLKARDVGVVTNLSILSGGSNTTTVTPPGSAPTDGSSWTWLPNTSHVWRSVPAVEGDLLTYQLRALYGSAGTASSVPGTFDLVIMNSATGTPKRWLSAASGTPLVPHQAGTADMRFYTGQWNVNAIPPVNITVQADDASADGSVHVTLGYKPLASTGFPVTGSTGDPGQASLLNYGNGSFPGAPVPQHGALSGLSNDDHPQYHNNARGDLRYPLLSSLGQASGIATLDGSTKVPIAQIPTGTSGTTVALGDHNHTFANLTGVSISSPATNQFLGYNGTNWTNARRFALAPVALTDAATIATDASQGNHFRVTLAGNRTLGVPTNPADGQKAIWEVIQDATGSRTLTLTTGSSGSFAFGTDITTITLTTTAAKRDFIGAVYNATAQRWFVIAFVKGY